MPIRVFKCKDETCQHEQEDLVKQEDTTTPVCEVCGAETAVVIRGTQFQLKGTGWARHGYK